MSSSNIVESINNENEAQLRTPNHLNKHIDILKKNLNMKLSALNAIKSSGSIIEDFKVINHVSFFNYKIHLNFN